MPLPRHHLSTRLPPPKTRQIINELYPALLPLIPERLDFDVGLVDIFTAFGGAPPWEGAPGQSCRNDTLAAAYPPCECFCDDQATPSIAGNALIAQKILSDELEDLTSFSVPFVLPFFFK